MLETDNSSGRAWARFFSSSDNNRLRINTATGELTVQTSNLAFLRTNLFCQFVQTVNSSASMNEMQTNLVGRSETA